MEHTVGKATGNHFEKDGRGRRVPEKVRNLIKDTFLDLIAEGKRGRDTSAQVVKKRIESQYPEVYDLLPSLQSVNKILEGYRKALGDKNPLEEYWSLSLWMTEAHGISRTDLPLILRVQKFMAVDINHRMSIGLKEYRLSVREAKWVGPVYEIFMSQDRDAEVDDSKPYFLHNLVSHVKDYARRERALELINVSTDREAPGDSYDLDLELAWTDVGFPFSNKGFLQQSLYKEMRLIPDVSLMTRGQEILNIELSEGLLAPDGGTGFEYGDRRLTPETQFIRQALLLFLEKGIEVKVRFGTDDWKILESKDRYDSVSWADGLEDIYSSSIDYVIDHDLLAPIWDLIKFEEDLSDSDSHQVRVATAFWRKIYDRIVQMLNDPEIKKAMQGGT